MNVFINDIPLVIKKTSDKVYKHSLREYRPIVPLAAVMNPLGPLEPD
jgi:hypothetical protein